MSNDQFNEIEAKFHDLEKQVKELSRTFKGDGRAKAVGITQLEGSILWLVKSINTPEPTDSQPTGFIKG